MGFKDLFRPKWKHSNVFVRLGAVQKLSNQTKLAEIAKKDADDTIRSAAVYRLTDQTRLADVALTSDSWEARYAALENLTDPNLRAKVLEKFDYNEKDMETFRAIAKAFNYDKDKLQCSPRTGQAVEELQRVMDVNAARVLNDTIEDKPASAGIDISHIHEHLQTGNKIKAIKLYREQTGAGLKEAKNAVEAIERGEMPLTETNSHGAKSKPTAADLPDFNKNDKTHVPKITQEYLTIILVESSTLGSAGPGGDSFQKAIQNMNNRDDATAIRCFEEALIKGLDPLRQGYVHANLGEMYIKTNVIEKALDEFKKVLNFKEALYESVHTAVQYLSILYRELGQPEVINVLEQLKYKTSSKINTSLSPETVERVRQLAIKNKSHLLERNAASSTPIDEGKSRKSISNNKEINKLEAKAQYYIDRKKDGKFDEVIADLAPIISKLPDKSDIRKILSSTYLDRGAANYQQGYDNKALADFEEATKVDQENWKALVNLSSLYMASYRWKEALKPLKSIMN